MNRRMVSLIVFTAAIVLLGGCSAPGEDVRVSFCKNLTQAMQPAGATIEWQASENTFRRPEYAVTTLRFEVVKADGGRSSMSSACHYAYEALEDTAITLATPLDAYATLPFAMTLAGRRLSDDELLRLVNAEQKRQGRAVLETLAKGVRDLADPVGAGIGQ